MSLSAVIAKLKNREDLSRDETRAAFDQIFTGTVDESDIADFLLGLRDKGETVDEITGAVIAMRSRMVTLNAPKNAIDIVGTGGDGLDTLNISTAVSLVVAANGIPVAKHGNRSASSRSGSSDVLAALGLKLDSDVFRLEACLYEANLCFMFAPNHHPAMRHVAPVRKKLGVRTIFNLLGPLTNPANVKRHMIGVYALDWLGPMAETLKSLGSENAWLVHGDDGMDEVTITGETDIVQLYQGMITHFVLSPEQIGLSRHPAAAIKGDDPAYNAEQVRLLLNGQAGAYRDTVVLNAAAALVVAKSALDLAQGRKMAETALDHGAAKAVLDKLIQITNRV